MLLPVSVPVVAFLNAVAALKPVSASVYIRDIVSSSKECKLLLLPVSVPAVAFVRAVETGLALSMYSRIFITFKILVFASLNIWQ